MLCTLASKQLHAMGGGRVVPLPGSGVYMLLSQTLADTQKLVDSWEKYDFLIFPHFTDQYFSEDYFCKEFSDFISIK